MVSEKIKRCNRSTLQSAAWHFKFFISDILPKTAFSLTIRPDFTFPANVNLLIHHLYNPTQVTIIFCRIKI